MAEAVIYVRAPASLKRRLEKAAREKGVAVKGNVSVAQLARSLIEDGLVLIESKRPVQHERPNGE